MNKTKYLLVLGGFLIFAAASCVTSAPKPEYAQIASQDPNHIFEAKGRHGVVAAAHPLASKAGLTMLKAGGNAIDAAVATSFMISVVRPQSTGIGGGGFALVHQANAGETKVYDFRERAPIKSSRDMYLDSSGNPKDFNYQGTEVPNASVNGHLAAGTPGVVAGLIKMHAEGGKLPFSKVIEPAIQIAENGFPVYHGLTESVAMRQKILTVFPASKSLLLPDGEPIKVGKLLVQKDLAATLRRIQKNGRDGFYKGETAKLLLAEIKRGKGLISQRDLDEYKVKIRKPIKGSYRGLDVVSMPPPSSGGIHIIQMLNMLEPTDYGKLGHNTSASIHLLAETMRRAFADRARYLGDPEFVKIPTKGLVSKNYAKQQMRSFKVNQATPSTVVGAGDPASYESSSTTHISVVDQWGNAVSTTQTVNYTFGSCVVVGGTGFILNNEMDDFSKKPGVPNAYGLVGSEANAIAARKTMLSSMSPTIVLKDGKVSMVLGSPGGPRIITATLQTILNVIDHKMPLKEAVHATRVHHQWLPDVLRIEGEELPLKVRQELAALGHKLNQKPAIGDVQAIKKIDTGEWVGVSDRRSDGSPMGY
jgi:gamma-glutamyltranspeptidase/glutathione hydrolase